MKQYKKSIFIFVVLLTIGIIGITVYKAQLTASLNDMVMEYLKEKEIQSILIQKYSSKEIKKHTDVYIKDKKDIEQIMKAFTEMKLKNDSSAKSTPNDTAYQFSIGGEHELIFSFIISEDGSVSTFDFASEEHHSYRITDHFDFNDLDDIYRLFSRVKE
ncbi:hypothetical protein [Paenibacillus sp. UMB4589-SE434]|uniref:hypothetical protein n=1 Tax=Paenibacillus sp. UMB4589-SE434 TaxID=3046314 RepID=UPI00254A22A9|nr:hypothetical protein [Paenibacillus sp. UMB4589-SE434]MDK8182277.1 hypothetical protein [Paenibacillus sp. UMB4589-SE434]